MSNQIDLKQFKQTNIVKKLSKSKSNENLKSIDDSVENVDTALKIMDATIDRKRGRKSKYNTDEERKEARRKQQREYRLRKKKELEDLKKMAGAQTIIGEQ